MPKNRNYSSPQYKKWRKLVFQRDNYTCALCGIQGGQKGKGIVAHHIKKWSQFPDLRFHIDNGITLCRTPCHDSITGSEEDYEAQFTEIVKRNKRKRRNKRDYISRNPYLRL